MPRTRRPLFGTRLAIVGTGAVAAVLAHGLSRAGAALVLVSRRGARASGLRRRVAAAVAGSARRTTASGRAAAALDGVDGALLCVPGARIAEVAEGLVAARPGGPPPGGVALHTCGFHGPEQLAPLVAAGWSAGVLHPLVPLPPRPAPPAPLEGAWFALRGDPAARGLARRIVSALGGRELALGGDPAAQRRYHAAASLVAGGVVALFDAAAEAFVASTADAPRAREALHALLSAAVSNLGALGPSGSVTGPASRGASAMVGAQLEALGDCEAGDLYRALLPRILALGARRGTLTGAERRRIEGLLRGIESP